MPKITQSQGVPANSHVLNQEYGYLIIESKKTCIESRINILVGYFPSKKACMNMCMIV